MTPPSTVAALPGKRLPPSGVDYSTGRLSRQMADDWRVNLAKDVARVAKKQKVAAKAASDGVESLLKEVSAARAAAAIGSPRDATELSARLRELGDEAVTSSGAAAKELTAVVGKLSKARSSASLPACCWCRV